jgi:hypothetical protein
VLSSEEWERARAAARAQVLDHLIAQPPSPSFNVLSQPVDGRAFLLAASEGRYFARRLRRRAAAGIAAFAAFVGFSASLVWALTHP